MSNLKSLLQKYEEFERPNLDSKHAIWEVHSVKAMGFFIGLLVVSVFPRILSISWIYWVLGIIIFGGYPGIMAFLRMHQRTNNL